MNLADLPDDKRNRAQVIREQLAALISEYVDVIRTDIDESVQGNDRPIVQAWVVGIEWTNIELERNDMGGRDSITPDGQTLSNSAGLGAYIADRYTG